MVPSLVLQSCVILQYNVSLSKSQFWITTESRPQICMTEGHLSLSKFCAGDEWLLETSEIQILHPQYINTPVQSTYKPSLLDYVMACT